MHRFLRKTWWLFFSLSLCFIVFGSIHAFAQSQNHIDCTFDISIEAGVTYTINALVDVNSITLPAIEMTYSKQDIINLASSEAAGDKEVMGAIKYALKGFILEQIHQTFPNCSINPLQDLPRFEAQKFVDEYQVVLTVDYFDVNKEVDINEVVNGFLDMGGVIEYSIPLSASPGWNNTFRFILPSEFKYQQITNASYQYNSIIWEHHNPDGTKQTKTEKMFLQYTDPTSPSLKNESKSIQFELDCQAPEIINFSTILTTYSLNMKSYDFLPSFISNIAVLPADGIRLCVKNNFTSWEELFNVTFHPIHQQIQQIIESSEFNQSFNPEFYWNTSTTNETIEPYNKTHMDSSPPILTVFNSKGVSLQIYNHSSRAVFGLVNAGAKGNITYEHINFGENLSTLPYPYQTTLLLPKYIQLNDASQIQWNEDAQLNATFSSDVSTRYNNQDIENFIDIEVKQTDLNLLSFFTGNTEMTVNVFIQEEQKRNITPIPEECSIPKELSLSLMNADAFRLCVEEQVFSNESIDMFLANQNIVFENRVLNIYPPFKGKSSIEKDAFLSSLQWDRNISSMDADSPFSVVSSMYNSYPLSFSFSILPPSIQVSSQNLSFSAITGQKTTYSMLFPKGLIISINDSLDRAEIEKLSNDQYLLTVSFNASDEGLTEYVLLTFHPTGFYIIGLFMPCILSVIITIILLIVVYVVRKKRNGFRFNRHPPSRGNGGGYENEEYYVPPPPPSAKK